MYDVVEVVLYIRVRVRVRQYRNLRPSVTLLAMPGMG